MPIPAKPLHDCTAAEVRAFLVAGTGISLAILAVSFLTNQPAWFLWLVHGFTLVWVFTAWQRGLKRLRELRSRK